MTAIPPPSAYQQALDFLYQRINYERTAVPYRSTGLKLDRMRRLLEMLGDPHLRVPAVHIAGTKGKGSTAAMISSVLAAAGYQVGLYTSPHLECVEERIAVNGQQCSPEEFGLRLSQVRNAVEELDQQANTSSEDPHGPTFFEIVTAMAFVHFAERQLDAAVLEVGLGGRLDSTNVCQPLVSVITSISFDHMKQLGNTLTEIATEKAGIIKPDVPVISGVTNTEPRDVIAKIAETRHAPLRQSGQDFGWERAASLSLWDRERGQTHRLDDVSLGMPGMHQAANAAVAYATVRLLEQHGFRISPDAMRTGLRHARCPARVEFIAGSPSVILDAAHNVASIEALLASLQADFGNRCKTLIFASSQDKDIAGMMPLLLDAFDNIIFTRFIHNPRSSSPAELAALAKSLRPFAKITVTDSPGEAWDKAKIQTPSNDLICVAGSFFLAAEIRPLLRSTQVSE